MKKFIAIGWFGVFTMTSAAALSTSHVPSLAFDTSVFDPAPFVKNDAPTYFGTYLARSLPFEPVRELKALLEQSINMSLKGRGEAHITVVTPPEYEEIKNRLNIEEINALVEASLQSTVFEPVCVGEAEANIDGKIEKVYFVVVHSDDLLHVRRQIAELFYQQGGNKSSFDAGAYFPHITLGYTKRDLHFQDGVIKNRDSCIANVNPVQGR